MLPECFFLTETFPNKLRPGKLLALKIFPQQFAVGKIVEKLLKSLLLKKQHIGKILESY